MKKRELIILLLIVLVSLGIIYLSSQKQEGDYQVDVKRGSEVILTFDSRENQTYSVEGDYGTMVIEVKDRRWHIYSVECPNYICEGMGWSSYDNEMGFLFPITCIPNNIIILPQETSVS